jgi:hypothetical protein
LSFREGTGFGHGGDLLSDGVLRLKVRD